MTKNPAVDLMDLMLGLHAAVIPFPRQFSTARHGETSRGTWRLAPERLSTNLSPSRVRQSLSDCAAGRGRRWRICP